MATQADSGNNQVGQRLRAARKLARMSLDQVEKATAGRYKSSVLGAYERGERALTVSRLTGLADLYGLDMNFLLAGDIEPGPPATSFIAAFCRGVVETVSVVPGGLECLLDLLRLRVLQANEQEYRAYESLLATAPTS